MLNQVLASRLDAAWGDPGQWIADGLQWTHLPEVRAAIARRVSGDANVDPLAWFLQQVARVHPMPLARVLVVGCGTGRVERVLVQQGFASEAVAVDLSGQVLAEARRLAGEAAPIHYLQADLNQLPVGQAPLLPGHFDAVFGVASVHHCEQLEALYEALHALLVPGGWLYLDEYVGPERFQYTDTHMRLSEELAALLPDRLLTTRSGKVRRGFRAPTIHEVMAIDPSEAVNSTRIVEALDGRFEVLAHRPYGGALLQVLLADVAQNFSGTGAPWLRALIQAEDDAIRQGRLEPHFACVIARARPPASA